jgi:hypothetical protein
MFGGISPVTRPEPTDNNGPLYHFGCSDGCCAGQDVGKSPLCCLKTGPKAGEGLPRL